jgi:hypothetical protein
VRREFQAAGYELQATGLKPRAGGATVSEADPRDVRNAGKPWSDVDVKRLRNLALGGQIMRLMVREMGRPEAELRAKAAAEGFELETGGYNRRSLYEENK